jgi:hypothetical protein
MANALFAEPSNRAGLVAHWPLDDGKGATLRELSSLSARGTCQGTQWASGNGAALEFVPPDGCVQVRTQTVRPFELSEAFTLAAWICPATLDGYRMLVSNGRQDSASSGYNFYLRGQSLGLILNAERKELYRAEVKCVDLAVGKWTYVAVTYQAQAKTVFFANGKPLGEAPAAGSVRYRPGHCYPRVQLCLGRVAACGDWFFEGLMRNVSIFNRALSSDEVAEEFCASRSIASLQLETSRQRAARMATAEIRGRILDERGRPVSAVVTLADRAGKHFGPSRLFYGNGSFFAVQGEFAVKVPPGDYRLTVTRGPEYWPYEGAVKARDGASTAAEVELKRFVDMNALGWYAGEHHYHYRTHGQILPAWSPTWAEATEAARAGSLSFVSYKETTRNAPVVEPDFLGREDMFEGRSHNNIGGHVEWLGVNEQPNRNTFAFLEAKRLNAIGIYDTSEQGGVAHIDDPTEVVVRDMVVAVAMEGAPIWDILKASSTGSDASTAWLLNAWYHFLNCGFKLAAGGFTDGDLNLPSCHRPPGFGRTYAKLPRLSWDEVLRAYRQGQVFATNGPLLLATVDGKLPGDVIRLPTKGAVSVNVEAFAQSGIDRVEIVSSGKVVHVEKGTGGPSLKKTISVELTDTSWLAARCTAHPSPHFGCFAHVSPIYIEVGAAPMRPKPEDIEFFLTWIDQYRRLLSRPEKISAWLGSPACFPEILEYLAEAEKIYRCLADTPRRW